jgi:ligand-binding sensor domain-containing protein
MKSIASIIVIIFFQLTTHAQEPIGKWRDHYSFVRGQHIAYSSTKIFVGVPNGIFWYNPQDKTIGKITSVNGLSDVDVSAIGYSPYQELLMVGYENGNMDMVFGDKIVNLPYIFQKPMQGTKQINHFNFDSNGEILVSTGFGIVVINILKEEIKETYFIGDGGTEQFVNQTIFYNNRIFAATRNGLISANRNEPLLIHYINWTREQGIPSLGVDYNLLATFKDNLIVNQNTGNLQPDIIRVFNGATWSTVNSELIKNNNIWANSNELIVSSPQGIGRLNSIGGSMSISSNYPGIYGFWPTQSIIDPLGNLAIADEYNGLVYNKGNQWQQILPNGPSNDNAYFTLTNNNEIIVAGGSRSDSWGSIGKPLTLHTLSQNQWKTIIKYSIQDAVRITASSTSSNEYFVSTWGYGVVVFRDGQMIENYTPDNSSLETIIPGPYCRIGGVTFDKKGNLWVSNSGVTHPISLRQPDGTWVKFAYQNAIGSLRQSDIILSPTDQLWVVLPLGAGLFVIDPGDNPSSISSHRTRTLKPSASDGTTLPNDIYSMAFDRDGYLWLGTNEGVLVSYNPHRVLETSVFAIQRVKIPDEIQGFAVYLLETQTVTSIAVDGGNRKWFGTQRSGVFLQSADGAKQLHHFTKENSPLPSNNIQHIAIEPKTGEVFIATDKGLVSYRGEATEPSDRYSKVYAFPNPVRPNYSGPITITGLVDKTIVKITDIAGNLVFEAESLGGQAVWDGKNLKGQKVSTGVYLFFCSDSQGEQSAVGKILFVK